MRALSHGLRICRLKSLENFTAARPSRNAFTSPSSQSDSSSIRSTRLNSWEKAPGISPISLSLKDFARFQGPQQWLRDDGIESCPSRNPERLTSFTFLLLRASSSCSSRERAKELARESIYFNIDLLFIQSQYHHSYQFPLRLFPFFFFKYLHAVIL